MISKRQFRVRRLEVKRPNGLACVHIKHAAGRVDFVFASPLTINVVYRSARHKAAAK